MGNEVGIEDSDGVTVGSIVEVEVVDELSAPASSLVAVEIEDKPWADTDSVAGSTVVVSDPGLIVVAGVKPPEGVRV